MDANARTPWRGIGATSDRFSDRTHRVVGVVVAAVGMAVVVAGLGLLLGVIGPGVLGGAATAVTVGGVLGPMTVFVPRWLASELD